jgi:hypothetical protein
MKGNADTAGFGGSIVSVKTVLLILAMLALSACGAVRAVRETERLADKYECLARNEGRTALPASQLTARAKVFCYAG